MFVRALVCGSVRVSERELMGAKVRYCTTWVRRAVLCLVLVCACAIGSRIQDSGSGCGVGVGVEFPRVVVAAC